MWRKFAGIGTAILLTACTLPPDEDVPAVIPDALQGRWGLVAADCTSTRGDAKGLLTISERQLRFYESIGTLTRVIERGPSRIVADFDFTGEGQTWKRDMILDVQDNGRTLVRREYGESPAPGPFLYTACDTDA